MSIPRIDVYTHHFSISNFDDRHYPAIREVLLPLVQYKLEKGRDGRYRQVPDKTYASANKDKTEYRIPITCYDHLLAALYRRGFGETELAIVHHQPYAAVKVKFKVNPKFVPRDYQEVVLEFMKKNPYPISVLPLQTGKGKAISLDSLVKVPGGWKLMGDIQVGDQVTAWDGNPTNVLAVYPQPVKQLYNVTFADGRKVEACGEHLWEVYYINTSVAQRWKIVDTKEMLRLISMPNPRVYVRLCESEDSVDKEFPLHPYLLGALLGDGHLGEHGITITKQDAFLIDKVRELIGDNHYLKQSTSRKISWRISSHDGNNQVFRACKDFGLTGKLSHEKFIPNDYLYGSTAQRWALLQGLMDTDGTVNVKTSGGSVSYSTTSERLADDVVYLVRSLGGIAKKSTRKPYYTYKGVRKAGLPAYQINIRLKKPSDAFTLPRKKERAIDDGQYTDILKLRVTSVEPSREGLSQCITVDHPDKLFVVNDFIVTHNTYLGLHMAAFFGVRTIIQLRGKYIESWVHDIKEILGIKKKGELLVIRGEKDLRNLHLMALGNEIEAKIIIVSTDTMRGYIDRYEAFKGTEEAELIAPIDFYQALGVGFKIVDETHEVTHMSSRIDTYTHVNHCLNLSATLDSDDQFINRMYNVYYPQHCRCPEVEYDRYIQATALLYRFKDPRKLKTSYKKGQYSHAAFEESILDNPSYMGPYFTMIGNLVSNIYMDNREEGQKLLIVSSLQIFSTLLETYLRARFPTVSINTFLFGDELSSLKESDISLSTFGSSGTGKDIPGLRYVIMQLSINSRSANRQTLGRLRRLKDWPDCTPEFYYLVCEDVPKQVEYHKNKYEVFKGRVLGHKELVLSERV